MHHFGTQPFSIHFGTPNDTYHQNNANHTDMRFTDRRNTLEAWRVPKREQDQKKHPMRNIVVRTMLPSATPATQHEGWCPKVPCLPRNMKVDVKKCHACPDHLSFMFQWGGVGWGGVGWGGVKTFMFLCTHRHSNLIIFLAVLQAQALLFHDQLPVGWGGVGSGNMYNLTWGYRQGIYNQYINRRVIYIYILYIYIKSAKRLTWKHSTAEIQGHHCRDCVGRVVEKLRSESRN